MAIKIISSNEPIYVKTIILYIYADPGIGKSSLAFTASKTVLFDFDNGAHRTNELRRGETIPVEKWTDVAGLEKSDLDPFDSIVIDTAGNMLECIKVHLALTSSNKQGDGTLTIKAQGVAGQMFRDYLARLRGYGKDIILIAHATEDKKKDSVIIRPDIGGKNQGLLYRQADLMAYFTKVDGKEGKSFKILDFIPNTSHHAKNSGGLGTLEVPDLLNNATFLADLIQRAKDHMNNLTDAQVKELSDRDDLTNWKHDCELCENAQDLNELASRIDKDHSRFQEMRVAMAAQVKKLDVTLDKETKKYFDNAFIPPTEPLTEQLPLSPEADAILTFIIQSTLEADLIRAEQQIADLAKSERQPLINAVHNRRIELEGQTQEFIAPEQVQKQGLEDTPACFLEEIDYEAKFQLLANVAQADALIRQIEEHPVQDERERLLVKANRLRTDLLNPQGNAA